jgi:hypothetical protein
MNGLDELPIYLQRRTSTVEFTRGSDPAGARSFDSTLNEGVGASIRRDAARFTVCGLIDLR